METVTGCNFQVYASKTDERKRKIASTLTFLGGCFAATDI